MDTRELVIPRRHAGIANACLAGMVGVGLGFIWWALQVRSFVAGEVTHADREAFADLWELGETMQYAAALGLMVTALMFVSWMFRVARNARRLSNEESPVSPGLAIYGWLIPLLNYYVPYKVMIDIWRESEPVTETNAPGDNSPGRDWGVVAIRIWWVGWLVAMASHFSLTGSIDQVEYLNDLNSLWHTSLFHGVVSALTGVAAIVVVRKVTARQAEHVPVEPAARVVAQR